MTHQARIDDLRAKLAARQGKPGFEENCQAIRSQIAVLEARLRATEAKEASE